MNGNVIGVYVFVIGLSLYAWRDWFISLCGLILLATIAVNPHYPINFGGIQGLNLWNILFVNVFLSWLMRRKSEGLSWDMPRNVNTLLVLWLVLVLIGWLWMMVDRSYMEAYPLSALVSDKLINTIKWPVAGLLLFDGCRTRFRAKLALVCLLLFYISFAWQIATSMPPGVMLGSLDLEDYRMDLQPDIGLTPNGAGKIMSGAPWAMLAAIPLLKKRIYGLLMFGAWAACVYALALTGSRSAYVACAAVGVLMCIIRWRRYLPLLWVAMLILPMVLPAVRWRMLEGMREVDASGAATKDAYAITAGRNLIWPHVIAKIRESPVFGFGRDGHVRTGLQQKLYNEVSEWEAVGHPHCAYFQILLDNGLIGLVVVVSLHLIILVYSVRLFADRGDPLFAAAGGATLALLASYLVSFLGGQSFYPREMDLGLWCAFGLALRLYVVRANLVAESNGAWGAGTYVPTDMTASQAPFDRTYA